MKFNFFQKYVSVLSTFLNTILILRFLGIEHLGLYAFLTASGNILSVFAATGLRSVYLREIVKHRDNPAEQRLFSVMAEVFPKVSSIAVVVGFALVASLTSLSTENVVAIAIIGVTLASAQLSSQKLRSHGLNTLSQMVVNVRPVILTFFLLGIGLIDSAALEGLFQILVVASFAIPAFFAYSFWLVKFRSLIFSRIDAVMTTKKAWEFSKEMPGLFALALGQKAITRFDVILVTWLLGLEEAGIYRIATQIVTVANSSQFPLQSKYLKKYSRLLSQDKLTEAEAISGRVARVGVTLFIIIFFAAAMAVYLSPFLEDIKYRPEFVWSLGILAILGLVKASVPMIENYVIYRNNTNKGGLLQIGVVIGNILLHLTLIPILGLPGACAAVLISIVAWRFTVKRFL